MILSTFGGELCRCSRPGSGPCTWVDTRWRKFRKVDVPTTLITDDVKQVPKRAGFFVRAFHGDIGEKAGTEIKRFITKTPLNRAFGHLHWAQVPMHRGDPAPEKAPISDDPEELAKHIKSLCYFLDADIVGICEMPKWAWFSHESDGTPIETRHKYAIVIVIDQGFDTMEGSSGDDWISGTQSYRAYLKGSTVACMGAGLHPPARVSGPSALQRGRRRSTNSSHGSRWTGRAEPDRGAGAQSVSRPRGTRPQSSPPTCPSRSTKPIDFGLQDFCGKCRKCARECPAQAIPYGDKVLYNGYEIWKPDVGKCVKYRVTNPKGFGVRPVHEDVPVQQRRSPGTPLGTVGGDPPTVDATFPHLARRRAQIRRAEPPSRSGGSTWRSATRKSKFPHGANERDLTLEREIRNDNKGIAVYPLETHPQADAKGPVPLDRKQGLEDCEEAARALQDLKT